MATIATEGVRERLGAGEIILNDGGLGTELAHHGFELPEGAWSAYALLLEGGEETVKNIHVDSILAGAEIIITNTFRTQNLPGQNAHTATQRAVDAARRAIDETGTHDKVVIAGSVGPVGDCYTPGDTPHQDVLTARHYPHAARLFASGADIFLPETMITVRETRLAAQAGVAAGFDALAVSFCTDPDGKNLHGAEDSVEDAVEAILPFDPVFIGVNCVEPDIATRTVEHLIGDLKIPVPVAVYAQGGHDLSTPRENVSPEAFQQYYIETAKRWLDLGVQIIGGCCGVRPDYIREIAQHVPAYSRTA